MNPAKSKEERQRIGTYRRDRDYEARDARDPDEKKPRRPPELQDHAKTFWNKHVNELWDAGWLRRDNVDVFSELCKQYRRMKDLEEFLDENGCFTLEITASGSKEVERPQSKKYEKIYESWYKKCTQIGIISDKPIARTPKKPKAEKPDIKDFGTLKRVK
jgi:phage terminase small subunit